METTNGLLEEVAAWEFKKHAWVLAVEADSETKTLTQSAVTALNVWMPQQSVLETLQKTVYWAYCNMKERLATLNAGKAARAQKMDSVRVRVALACLANVVTHTASRAHTIKFVEHTLAYSASSWPESLRQSMAAAPQASEEPVKPTTQHPKKQFKVSL